MFDELADLVGRAYPKERLLLVGFAETATAIGAHLAVRLQSRYLQTTREDVPGAEYLCFSETHSHATEQRLVRTAPDRILRSGGADRIVFVEDEVTTGNTILNIIDIMEREYPGCPPFSVASLLNGMDPEARARYDSRGIALHYLLKTCHDGYTDRADRAAGDGTSFPCRTDAPSLPIRELTVPGAVDPRVFTDGDSCRLACGQLWQSVRPLIEGSSADRILVLGTEECMYPALFVAREAERAGRCVRCHSTTRSPIQPGTGEDYPLHAAYELRSLYDRERITWIYDLAAYDLVLIVTDAPSVGEDGGNSLQNALADCGNQNIVFVRWCVS